VIEQLDRDGRRIELMGSFGRFPYTFIVVARQLKSGKWRAYVMTERNPVTGIYGSYEYTAVRDLDWNMVTASTLDDLRQKLRTLFANANWSD